MARERNPEHQDPSGAPSFTPPEFDLLDVPLERLPLDLADPIDLPRGWWGLFLVLLGQGQTLENACEWVSVTTKQFVSKDAIKALMDHDWRVKLSVRSAMASRRMAARCRLGQEVETDPAVALKYLERTDPAFLPKSDMFSTMSEDELRAYVFGTDRATPEAGAGSPGEAEGQAGPDEPGTPGPKPADSDPLA